MRSPPKAVTRALMSFFTRRLVDGRSTHCGRSGDPRESGRRACRGRWRHRSRGGVSSERTPLHGGRPSRRPRRSGCASEEGALPSSISPLRTITAYTRRWTGMSSSFATRPARCTPSMRSERTFRASSCATSESPCISELGDAEVATVLVGAIGVGRIGLSFDDLLDQHGLPGGWAPAALQGGRMLSDARGAELGAFHLGSTVVVLTSAPVEFRAIGR